MLSIPPLEQDPQVIKLLKSPFQPTLKDVVKIAKSRKIESVSELWDLFDAIIILHRQSRSYEADWT